MSETFDSIFPENIRTIAVTAPAGAPDCEKLHNSLQYLAGCNVNIHSYIAAKDSSDFSYLAGSVQQRADLFNRAVNDPEADLVLCVRGGFGSVHILDRIDFTALRDRQLPVMGYSDITALHCAMLKNSAGTVIAGSNLIGIEQTASDKLTLESHRNALKNSAYTKIESSTVKQLRKVTDYPATDITARAAALNLTVLASLCGTPFMPDFSGMILILEDINEPVYKIDRMLTQLAINGVFSNLAMLIFGNFSGTESTELEMLFKRFADTLNIPCLSNFPFGHCFPMHAVNASQMMHIPALFQN